MEFINVTLVGEYNNKLEYRKEIIRKNDVRGISQYKEYDKEYDLTDKQKEVVKSIIHLDDEYSTRLFVDDTIIRLAQKLGILMGDL